MEKAKIVVVLTLSLVAGYFIGTAPSMTYSLPEFDILGSDDSSTDNVLYDINSSEEWMAQSGTMWPAKYTNLAGDRMEIIREEFPMEWYGYNSLTVYRTKEIKATDGNLQLSKLEAEGYIPGNESMLIVNIQDCSGSLIGGNATTQQRYCGQDSVIYNKTFTEPGEVNFEDDVSDISIEGYLNVKLWALTNDFDNKRTEKVYWDSVRLTKKPAESSDPLL